MSPDYFVTHVSGPYRRTAVPHSKQLQRTVQTVSRRGARASFHCARAPRFTRQRAAAELRRYTARMAYRGSKLILPLTQEFTVGE